VPEAQVLFISQRGDEGRLRGLYEVMQILDIVPVDGPRSVSRDRFEIEGIGNGIHSYTSATLRDGEIKGFTLVWPEGDEQRRSRILAAMQDSFTRLNGTLDPNIVPASAEQSVDLVAGLSVRQPQLTGSGFYVTSDGHAVTSAATVANCTRVTLDRDAEMTILATDPDLGIAILAPIEAQTPIAVAALNVSVPRLRTRIAVAGFPYEGALADPTLTFGDIADIRSLTGDTRVLRLSVSARPSDAGGPILNENGAVLGMLLPKTVTGGQVLPADVSFALKSSQIAPLLELQSLTTAPDTTSEPLSSVALASQAADMTVLVSCW
jgi:S1-C subfamily serine protease